MQNFVLKPIPPSKIATGTSIKNRNFLEWQQLANFSIHLTSLLSEYEEPSLLGHLSWYYARMATNI